MSSSEKLILVVMAIVLGAAIYFFANPQTAIVPEGQLCDANNPCPEGFDCYKFPNKDQPICFKGDPCTACTGHKCAIAESYPMQVFCQ